MAIRWMHTWQLYDVIPMKSKSILPDEGFEPMLVNLAYSSNDGGPLMSFQVYCKPKPNKGYAKHRVFAICDCGRHVPFGRMGQHWNKPTCKKA